MTIIAKMNVIPVKRMRRLRRRGFLFLGFLRSFGKTSLHEVQRQLAEHGLSLGMAGGDLAGGESAGGDDPSRPDGGPGGPTPDRDACSPGTLDSSPDPGESAASSMNTGSGPTDQRADLSVFTMDD